MAPCWQSPCYGIVPLLEQVGPLSFDPTQISTSLKPLLPEASSAISVTEVIACGDDSVTSIQQRTTAVHIKPLAPPIAERDDQLVDLLVIRRILRAIPYKNAVDVE